MLSLVSLEFFQRIMGSFQEFRCFFITVISCSFDFPSISSGLPLFYHHYYLLALLVLKSPSLGCESISFVFLFPPHFSRWLLTFILFMNQMHCRAITLFCRQRRRNKSLGHHSLRESRENKNFSKDVLYEAKKRVSKSKRLLLSLLSLVNRRTFIPTRHY